MGSYTHTNTTTTIMPAKKKKVAKKSESCIFDKFSSKQIAEFKEGFVVMDKDKDGLISQSDIAATFADLGRPGSDDDFAQMVADAGAPISFPVLVNKMMTMQLLQLSSPLRVLPQELLTPTNSKPCSRPLVKSSPTKKLRMYSAWLK